jgi:hypothetical protein
MYWIVESDEQLSLFSNSGYKEAYVDIVGSDSKVHPVEDSICLVYIRPLQATKGFVIPINHTEALKVDEKKVFKILSSYKTLYCKDIKRLWHYWSLSNLHDVNWSDRTGEGNQTKTHKTFNRWYPSLGSINRIIPIVKHYQALQKDYDQVRSFIGKTPSKYEQYYNNRASVVYHNIERNGLGIDTGLFFKHFYRRDKPVVYNQYNLNTTTTRPSNKFGGVNYAALNKKTGERSAFTPRNDYFAEFDVKAYHPVIVSHLIGFEFTDPDVHQSFATMYGVDREEAKQITFQQFYGRVFAKYKDLSYFKLLLDKQQELVDQYNNKGFLEEPISGYRFEKNILGEMNKEKLFNYFLQATESAYNVEILEQIQEILKGSQTKIVLTVYDSFLFDVKSGEENLLKNIQKVFKNKKLNTSIKSGYDYNFK